MADDSSLITMTAEIVGAFVGRNAVQVGELHGLIKSVHEALEVIAAPEPVAEPTAELKPAVPIRNSVTDDHIICLEDGKKFKSMRRHLQTAFGMTPDDYRAKWGLPRDYPMTAAGYSARRSELAKALGLNARRRRDGLDTAKATRAPKRASRAKEAA